jgi:hypothetical protein
LLAKEANVRRAQIGHEKRHPLSHKPRDERNVAAEPGRRSSPTRADEPRMSMLPVEPAYRLAAAVMDDCAVASGKASARSIGLNRIRRRFGKGTTGALR